MVIRRAAFDCAGGFDPQLGAGARFASGEDEDMARRIVRAGFPVCYVPRSVVVHEGARSYLDGSAQRLLRGQATAFGAIFAKELRLGHIAALGDATRFMLRLCWRSLVPGTPAGRSLGVARVIAFAGGYWRGMRQPLQRERGVFVDGDS